MMIYFDNAATTGKKPESVINAVEKALKFYNANPGRSGHTMSAKCADAVYKVREKVSTFFGASGPENVVFTMNCTHSINCILKGVLNRGDHVIVSSLEHNAVMRPLKSTGVIFDVAKVDFENDEKTLQEFKSKIKPNTKLIICTGGSNVFGKLLPVEKIGKLCKSRGILFAVDGAQIAGVIPINMKQMNIDYLAIAPHKGLYSPMGIGILICEKPIEKTIIEGGTGTNSIELFQPDLLPEKLESGTVNLPAIFGVGAGIDFVSEKGIKKIHSYELRLLDEVYDALAKREFVELYCKRPKSDMYAPVLSFNIKGVHSELVSSFLSKNGVAVRGGLHCAPVAHRYMGTVDIGTVRVSTSVFNTNAEINNFIRLISNEKNIKNMKKSID